MLLDGVRLFNAIHLGGFISSINAEVVDRATLLTGSSVDALAIGSLSGAIDIATRDGSETGGEWLALWVPLPPGSPWKGRSARACRIC